MKHLDNSSVLMQYNFLFMYISDPGGKPSLNNCFLLTSLNIATRCRDYPAELQHAVTVILPAALQHAVSVLLP